MGFKEFLRKEEKKRRDMVENKAYSDLNFFLNAIKRNKELDAFLLCVQEEHSKRYSSNKYELENIYIVENVWRYHPEISSLTIGMIQREKGRGRVIVGCDIIKRKSAMAFFLVEQPFRLLTLILWSKFDEQLAMAMDSNEPFRDSLHISFIVGKMPRTWEDLQGNVKIVTSVQLEEWLTGKGVKWRPQVFLQNNKW